MRVLKKTSPIPPFILSLAIVFMVLSLTCSVSFARNLDDIRAAISHRRAKWTAEETSMSRLPDHEKRQRLGLVMEVSAGNEPLLSVPPVPSVQAPLQGRERGWTGGKAAIQRPSGIRGTAEVVGPLLPQGLLNPTISSKDMAYRAQTMTGRKRSFFPAALPGVAMAGISIERPTISGTRVCLPSRIFLTQPRPPMTCAATQPQDG